jgi:hypothetical protein
MYVCEWTLCRGRDTGGAVGDVNGGGTALGV